VEVISADFLWGCGVFALGSVGIWWATRRDLVSARRYPNKWHVGVQERLTVLSRWVMAVAVGVFALAGTLYLVQHV
jgi:hypothetical protein